MNNNPLNDVILYMGAQPVGQKLPLTAVSKDTGVDLSTLRSLVRGHKADLERAGIAVQVNPATGKGNPLLMKTE
jgi:hypothetical protein